MLKALLIAVIYLFTNGAQAAAPCSNMVLNGKFPTTVVAEPVKIICHQRYVVGYSVLRKSPIWTAEVLTAAQVAAATNPRAGSFKPDPALPADQQALLTDFEGNNYDRGHMIPFEDLADDPAAAAEGFFLTNIVPQVSTQNRGIWQAVEKRARKIAAANGSVIIMTGPIFDGTPTLLRSGAHIPTRLWKMILIPATKEAYTVVIPNADGLSSSTMPLYMTTVVNLKKMNPKVNLLPGSRITWTDRKDF